VIFVDENKTEYVAVLARVNPNKMDDLFVFVSGPGIVQYVPRIPNKENAFVDDDGNYPYPYYEIGEIELTPPEIPTEPPPGETLPAPPVDELENPEQLPTS
jgi:hypothetical protein